MYMYNWLIDWDIFCYYNCKHPLYFTYHGNFIHSSHVFIITRNDIKGSISFCPFKTCHLWLLRPLKKIRAILELPHNKLIRGIILTFYFWNLTEVLFFFLYIRFWWQPKFNCFRPSFPTTEQNISRWWREWGWNCD